MNTIRNIFSRNSKKDDISFTEITTLQPGVFINENSEFEEIVGKRCRIRVSVDNATRPLVFCEHRISPMKEWMTKQPPVYSQKDLDRIAKIFLVTNTHYNNEEELLNYQNRKSSGYQKKTKLVRNFLKQIRKIIS